MLHHSNFHLKFRRRTPEWPVASIMPKAFSAMALRLDLSARQGAILAVRSLTAASGAAVAEVAAEHHSAAQLVSAKPAGERTANDLALHRRRPVLTLSSCF